MPHALAAGCDTLIYSPAAQRFGVELSVPVQQPQVSYVLPTLYFPDAPVRSSFTLP